MRTENATLRAGRVASLSLGVFFQHTKPGQKCGIGKRAEWGYNEHAAFVAG
jgi:hypothetical protein